MITGNEVTPTSTTLQARVMIFQPSIRPQLRVGEWIETSHGKCRVKGRLGQRHADVLESILYVAEKRKECDGGVDLLVDPARLRRSLSENQYSYSQIEKLLEELRSATITIESPGFNFPIIGGLVDHVVPSTKTRHNPLNGGIRNLWRVRLGVALVMLLEHDLTLKYEPLPLAKLEHGVSKAVARHILTHKNNPTGGWLLDTLIHAVYGHDISSQTRRDARRRIKKDMHRLAEMEIVVTDTNRVYRGKRGALAR